MFSINRLTDTRTRAPTMQQFSHLPDQQILEGDTNPSGIASGRTSELLWQSFVNKGEAQSSFFLYGVDPGDTSGHWNCKFCHVHIDF